MFFRSLARLARPGATLLLWGIFAWSHAAELGEPQVRSFLGQPLIADIELTNLADPSHPVLVKLANPEVYNGAGIKVHPVLANVMMSVMRRDGRQFLHITSIKPVETEYVHVFLELSEAGKPAIRGATLWFTADPNPPPPPSAAPKLVPVPAPEVSAASSMGEGEEIVAPAPAVAPAALPRARSHARVAACAPPSEAEKAKLCATIDYKNGLLTAQIVELEDKVRLLQTAIEGKVPPHAPASASAAASAAHLPPPRLGAASAAKTKKPVAEPFPWLLIGGAVTALLLVSGGGWYVWRRKTGKGGGEAKPGMLARLKAKFGKKSGDEAPKEEPTAE